MTYQPQRILVAFDFSEPSLNAVRQSLTIADNSGKIKVANIIDDNFPSYLSYEFPDVVDRTLETLRNRKMRDSIVAAGIETDRLEFVSEFGDPGTELPRIADENDTDLIIIPSCSRRGFRRVLLGSVAERVAGLASCSVLILKPQPVD